ncbi:MAG TPA: SRPBCC family protein [Gemmatimonadaceae bacterium]|nr:SRPBCC family protein [Gemmatimonadaceae bacterium]
MTLPVPAYDLGPMPSGLRMTTVDELEVHAPLDRIFRLAAGVKEWPRLLPHYYDVAFRERTVDGGGLVEMIAFRPFGFLRWPVWWVSQMEIFPERDLRGRGPVIRFRHVAGVTTGMEVEWRFRPTETGTHVRIVHVWSGPTWRFIGGLAARLVIGPIFIHGIASRTVAGLAREAERTWA